MNICTNFYVIPASGLPVIAASGLFVIPAAEPESEDNGRSLDSCLRRNDEFKDCT